MAGINLAALTLPQLVFIAIVAFVIVTFFMLVGRTMNGE